MGHSCPTCKWIEFYTQLAKKAIFINVIHLLQRDRTLEAAKGRLITSY